MSLKKIVTKLHTSTKRDYLARVNSVDKAWAAKKPGSGDMITGMEAVILDMAGINMMGAGARSSRPDRYLQLTGRRKILDVGSGKGFCCMT